MCSWSRSRISPARGRRDGDQWQRQFRERGAGNQLRQLDRLLHRGVSGITGGRLRPSVDLSLHVGDDHMGRVEDAHFFICHMVCYHFMDTET